MKLKRQESLQNEYNSAKGMDEIARTWRKNGVGLLKIQTKEKKED